MNCNEIERQERIVKVGEAGIFTESFGSEKDPAILLMAGATVSMLFWDEDFCRRLSENGFFVIRYDYRDVGKSTSYPPGEVNYVLSDFMDDAIAILDDYNLPDAHLAGMSLGGLLAQMVAIKCPAKVKSLCLISSGPFGPSDPEIPEMDSSILDFHSRASAIDWTNEDAVVAYMLGGAKLMTGSKGFEKERAENFIRQEFRRADNYITMFNHAQLQGGEEFYGRLGEINRPVLIIHGTDDKIWHFKHTEVLQKELKQSELVVLRGTGHELRKDDWSKIINAIATHIEGTLK